jgi:putative ABC transport system substrate-binding protein
MRRREFIALAGGAAAIWPLVAHAQQPRARVFRVGFLGLPSADSLPERTEAFRGGLRELGYQEGRNLIIEYRWANSDYKRIPALFAELVELRVDVIVTHGTPGAMVAKQAGPTMPVVIAVVGDAVASGVVASLARPGGNLTGLSYFQPELNAKRLELMREAVPDMMNVGVLLNPGNQMMEPVLREVAQMARSLGITLHQFSAGEPAEFDEAFAAMAASQVRGFLVFDDAMLIGNAPALAEGALKQRLCSCGFAELATGGGLLAYGVDFPDMFRRSAAYVDKILKGARPADLPVEQATRFETILNLKTARVLGIDIPPLLLARADQVIE